MRYAIYMRKVIFSLTDRGIMKKLLIITFFVISASNAMVPFSENLYAEDGRVTWFLSNNPRDALVPTLTGPRLPEFVPPDFIPEQQLHDIAIKIIGIGIETKQLRFFNRQLVAFVILKLTDTLRNQQKQTLSLRFLYDLFFWFDIITTLPELAEYRYKEDTLPYDSQDHLVP